ncbi:MAG: hypothetical protein PHU06_02580 [Gallionella sp.]|nr:hypothetical protein [Gallionella sp.]MDD4958295.1 hypothetical protein [Gallionella sp.]
MKNTTLTVLLLAGCWTQSTLAAPLDALLTAVPNDKAGAAKLELGYDVINNTLDVFGVRAKDPVYGGTNVGDYNGFHLRGGYAITEKLWVDGGVWQRNIAYRNEQENITSWQLATQYRLTDQGSQAGQYAVRLGMWGNVAPIVTKNSATSIPNINLQSVSVSKPQDFQVQADLIGTWAMGMQSQLSAFIGAGVSRIAVGTLTGKVNGCDYNIVSNAQGTYASLNAPCNNLTSASYSSPSTLAQWLSYTSQYYQLGGQFQWRKENWQVNTGYQFQYLNRDQVDAAIVQRGGIAYKTNHIVVAEIERKMDKHLALFARGQVMSNQFVGEMPFTYNSSTASKFGRLYGFTSFGARWIF